MSRAPLDLLTELIDAAEQTADFVSGVVGLASGRLGGDVVDGKSWFARRLAGAADRFRLGSGQVAEGFAVAYGPEQLRKAAGEARRMTSVLEELRATGAVPDLVAQLDDLDVPGMADELSELGPRSSGLRELQRRLARSTGAMNETRVRLLLDR